MNSPVYSRELLSLLALRQARDDFFNEVVNHAEAWRSEHDMDDLNVEQIKLLRSPGVEAIAEIFFVIKDRELHVTEELRNFLSRHNKAMGSLLESSEKGYTRCGLSKARVKKAIFSPKQIDFVIHESNNGRVVFDQFSFSRVLVQAMSFASCRTLLVLLAECGLIWRHDVGHVLISSNGVIEGIYKGHLSSIASSILQAAEMEKLQQKEEAIA